MPAARVRRLELHIPVVAVIARTEHPDLYAAADKQLPALQDAAFNRMADIGQDFNREL